ncbi:MAG: histidinol-phosphate aminotransferase family protein [Gammaproteobacteria bacterium]|nr:histidinol-phosphate aminotransferase family protein [Gammaproteobacteria bacterium]
MSRRRFMGGALAGAAVFALSPTAGMAVGPARGYIHLNSNENPYGPSAAALRAAYRASEVGAYYAGSINRELQQVIAEENGLTLDNMVLSSGSNEALSAAVVAWGKKGRILAPALTYDLHMKYAQRIGAEIRRVPLAADMSIDLDAMEKAVDRSVSMVYVCNPNNPTGMLIDGDELREFCGRVSQRATVLVDEAYSELTGDPEYSSMIDLVRNGGNVIIMRTFSKLHGLAGMRVGYGMARPDLAARVRHHVMAWPNVIGLAAAKASFEDHAFRSYSRSKIIEGRKVVNDAFTRHSIRPLPSETNFVFADIGRDVDAFAEKLLEKRIRIHASYPDYPTYARVSMGIVEDLHTFADVFDQLITT